MSGGNGMTWAGFGRWAFGALLLLVTVLYANARADMAENARNDKELQDRVTAMERAYERLDGRLGRMDDKLDAIVERLRTPYNPGPRR